MSVWSLTVDSNKIANFGSFHRQHLNSWSGTIKLVQTLRYLLLLKRLWASFESFTTKILVYSLIWLPLLTFKTELSKGYHGMMHAYFVDLTAALETRLIFLAKKPFRKSPQEAVIWQRMSAKISIQTVEIHVTWSFMWFGRERMQMGNISLVRVSGFRHSAQSKSRIK